MMILVGFGAFRPVSHFMPFVVCVCVVDRSVTCLLKCDRQEDHQTLFWEKKTQTEDRNTEMGLNGNFWTSVSRIGETPPATQKLRWPSVCLLHVSYKTGTGPVGVRCLSPTIWKYFNLLLSRQTHLRLHGRVDSTGRCPHFHTQLMEACIWETILLPGRLWVSMTGCPLHLQSVPSQLMTAQHKQRYVEMQPNRWYLTMFAHSVAKFEQYLSTWQRRKITMIAGAVSQNTPRNVHSQAHSGMKVRKT